jgi:phage protein U
MSLFTITQQVSQASTAVARAASHVQRLGELANTMANTTRPVESLFRLASNTTAELARSATALKGVAALLPASVLSSIERSTVGRSLAALQTGITDINRRTQQVGRSVDAGKATARRLGAAVQSIQSAAIAVGNQVTAVKTHLGSGSPGATAVASTVGSATSPLPSLSSARAHLLVMIAEQGQRFYFGLNTAAFDSLRRQSNYNIATQERLGRPEALQAVNQGGESLTLSGVVFAQMAGMSQLNTLRRIGFQMKPVQLIAGHGETLGRWYLTSISEDQSDLMADGAPRKQTFTVEFKRYGDDYQNL